MRAQDFAQNSLVFGFVEDDAQVACRTTADPSARTKVLGRDDSGETATVKQLYGSRQLQRFANLRRRGPARLFGGFARDATPALYALGGSQRQMLFRAPRHNRNDCRHVQLGALFDGPLHAIELEDG